RVAASRMDSSGSTSKVSPVSDNRTVWRIIESPTWICVAKLLFFNISFDQDGHVFRTQLVSQSLQACQASLGVLLAVATAQANTANDFAINHNREAPYKSGKAPFKAQLDAKGFVARQGGAVGRGGKQV